MLIDMNIDREKNQKLIVQTSIPRPIAWIITENEEGATNIAPYSLFTPLSANPASLVVSIRTKEDGTQKDTLLNIRKNKKCTICMVEESNLEKLHLSSIEIDREVSEAEEFEIETLNLLDEYPPIIKDAPIAYFCEFNQEITLEGDSTIPLILNINEMFVDDRVIEKEKLEINFEPLAHVGADYATLGKRIKAPIIK